MGGLLLMPLYAKGILGAGLVKLQMAFGAWAGAIHGAAYGSLVVLIGCLAGLAIGGVMVWFWRPRPEVLGDQPAPRNLVPFAVPLCTGYIGTLIVWHLIR